MTHLVEILLPLKDASGEDFPAAYYDDLAKELVANFGGVTSFLRAPAEGRWHDSGSTLARLLWVYRTDCGHERDVTPSTVPTARGDASARRE